jgi:cytosine permease
MSTSIEKGFLEDYGLEPVPQEKRKHWLSIAVVWIGVAIVMSALLRGMIVGMGLGRLSRVILAFLLGEVILIIMMALSGYIGARTGLSTPLIARTAFGNIGSAIISLSIALSLIGWFGVQANLFARTILAYVKIDIPLAPLAFCGGLLMMTTAVIGFRGLKFLSWVAVPIMLVIFITTVFKLNIPLLPPHKLIALAKAHNPNPYPISIGSAATIVAGGFIVGAVTSSDVARYARSKLKDIFYAATFAMSASALLHFVGAILTMKTGKYHEMLPELIISPAYAGLGLLGFIALLLAQWTTNDNNLYSAVLALNNIIRWEKWKLTIIVGLLSSLLAAIGILERLELFLVLLTAGIGPIGGIIVADYYILGRKNASDMRKAWNKQFNLPALIAYFAACGIGWTTSGHPFSLAIFPFSVGAFNGIISATVLYYLLTKFFPKKSVN